MAIPDPKFAALEMPWARAMQASHEAMQTDLDNKAQNDLNVNKGQNATIQSLGETVQTLQDQVASISMLLANQIDPVVLHSESSSFGVPASATEMIRVTFTVPTGFTRALVLAVGSITAINSSTSSGVALNAYADINGGSSTSSTAMLCAPVSQGAVTAATSTILTGLTAGSTFFVRLVAHTTVLAFATNASNRTNIDSSVLFLP